MRAHHLVVVITLAAALTIAPSVRAQDKSIVVASTTSTQDSGLFGHILPLFKAKSGIDVKVIALGTGQALDTARRGDADVVFVHAKAQEEKFVAEGFRRAALRRHVQRLRRHRSQGQRSGQGSRASKDVARRPQDDQRQAEPIRLTW